MSAERRLQALGGSSPDLSTEFNPQILWVVSVGSDFSDIVNKRLPLNSYAN